MAREEYEEVLVSMKPALSIFTLIALITTTHAYADDQCDDLWLSRNIIFDSYGHCFSSPLGQATFDNTGCSKTPTPLDAFDKAAVASLRAQETHLMCKVDTKRTLLNVTAIDQRQLLATQPMASEYESACIGYNGEFPIALYAGPSTFTTVLGFIQKNDNANWWHENTGEWAFMTVFQPDGSEKIGWTNEPVNQCTSFAG